MNRKNLRKRERKIIKKKINKMHVFIFSFTDLLKCMSKMAKSKHEIRIQLQKKKRKHAKTKMHTFYKSIYFKCKNTKG